MIGYEWEILAIAAVTACACALPGSFLVLRQSAMLSDAVSHAVLPGIVVAFLLTGSLTSPLLVLGAAATGVLTVSLVELLRRTRLLREDAAIGLTFPILFSIGVVLVSRYAGSVHLDVDAVLLGELAFAPFRRVGFGGHDLGPEALLTMSRVLVLNLAFITVLFKELQLVTFDPRPRGFARFPSLPAALRAHGVGFHHGGRGVRRGRLGPGGGVDGRATGGGAASDGPSLAHVAAQRPHRHRQCGAGLARGASTRRFHRRVHGHRGGRAVRDDLPGRLPRPGSSRRSDAGRSDGGISGAPCWRFTFCTTVTRPRPTRSAGSTGSTCICVGRSRSSRGSCVRRSARARSSARGRSSPRIQFVSTTRRRFETYGLP